MAVRALPRDWPRRVPPPVDDAWVPAASAWLLDQCPPEYRDVPVLRRHPMVLARFASWHCQAQSAAVRHGLAVARQELRGAGVRAVEQAQQVLERELVRLEVVARQIAALEHALSVVASPDR